MQTSVFHLAARVDPGMPVQRRRHRMRRFHKQNKQQMPFEAQLHRARGKKEKPAIMPPVVEKPTDETERPPLVSSRALRNTWRQGFFHGLRHMRDAHRGTHQNQVGWVKTRLGKALTNDPFMAEKDIEKLVDSLMKAAPMYGDEEK